MDFEPFTWRLRWAGSEQPVVPVAVNDQFVFTHKSGVQVTFDGWNITRVAGLLGREALILTLNEVGVLRITRAFKASIKAPANPGQPNPTASPSAARTWSPDVLRWINREYPSAFFYHTSGLSGACARALTEGILIPWLIVLPLF